MEKMKQKAEKERAAGEKATASEKVRASDILGFSSCFSFILMKVLLSYCSLSNHNFADYKFKIYGILKKKKNFACKIM